MSSQTQDAARRYLERGFGVIPVPPGEKNPNRRDWQDERHTIKDVPRLWNNGQSIGLLTGEPSGHLVDVDLDCGEAVKLAGRFLPPTLTSGRESRPDSHWWFIAEDAETDEFRDTNKEKLVEFRAGGRQTVVAPSKHPSGEKYLWSESGLQIERVRASELALAVRELATATLVSRHLPSSKDEATNEGGGRHDYGMPLSGYMLRSGRLDEERVLKILTAAWDARGFLNESKRREAHQDLRGIVRDTARKLERGERVYGGGELEKLVPGMPARIAGYWGWDDRADAGSEEESKKPTQAELLIRCSAGAELFHNPEGESYATIPVGEGPAEHQETHQIKAKGFRRWLVRSYFEEHERPPGAQALQDALGLLEARAQFEGATREVHVRLAEANGCIYLDLADEAWWAVEVSAEGWKVVSGSEIPVRFRRPRGMLPLPEPAVSEEGVEGLRELINVGRTTSGDSFTLLVAWLVAALRPTGPYPVLVLQGEQGSAKSTAERILRALVDPSTAPLRTMPRNERDLIIAATNSWCMAYDNISTLAPWLSDAVCRASTGGGFSARELYTDSEEVLFEATRPVLLNGIADVATRPDLLDRSLVVTLPAIPDEKRRPEADLWREFEHRRPAILAGLLDAVSGALRTVESVRLEGMPRMADFARWVTAAESSLGWQEGAFMEAYSGNRAEANEAAMEADPVAVAVVKLLEDLKTGEQWTGTTGELYKALGDLTDDEIRHTKVWPGAPNVLTARLKRLAPVLRESGIEYIENREGHGGKRTKTLRKNSGEKDRQQRQRRQQGENYLQNAENAADGLGGSADGPAQSANSIVSTDRQQEYPIDKGIQHDADDADSADDELQPHSSLAALLESRPEWLTRQARKCMEEGAPERLLKPLSSTIAHTYLGNVHRSEEALAFIRGHLEELAQ